jgi:hypothetical protein
MSRGWGNLDGPASYQGNPARGARFNSAVRYVNDAEERLAVVVSEDGHVDLLPRLRRSIRRSELDAMLETVRALPDGPVPDEVRPICKRLARDYSEYVDDADWTKIARGAWAGLDLDGEGDALMGTFEMHSSDIIAE